MCVDHEQVDRVRADVEDPEAHGRDGIRPTAPYADPVPEVDLDFPRAWVEFVDPADDGQVFRCDLTWLTSSWTCIFGSGCAGVIEGRPDDGCCTLGAHFSEKNEERAAAGSRQPSRRGRPGELHAASRQAAGSRPTRRAPARRASSTVPASSSTARASPAALAALCTGWRCARVGTPSRPSPTSAGSCRSGVPSDVTRTDGSQVLVVSIGEYDRRGWGPGGHDLSWYCSGNTEAHVGREPVFRSNAPELEALMGPGGYAELARLCEQRLASGGRRGRDLLAPHPADP